MKNNYMPAKRKRLNLKNVSWIEEKRLIKKGRKDVKFGIVRKNSEGYYFSPFFKQEVYLCCALIMAEREYLQAILLNIDVQTSNQSNQLEFMNEKMESLSELLGSCNIPIVTVKKENSLFENVCEKHLAAEESVKKSSIENRIEALIKSIVYTTAKNRENSIRIEREIEITKLRCFKIYSIMQARLSIYWRGVLMASADNAGLPPIYPVDAIDEILKDNLEV